MITASELKTLLTYYPETGDFRWNIRSVGMFRGTEKRSAEHICNLWNSQYADKLAGSYDKDGYRVIFIKDRAYKAHQLAWLYMTGTWPTKLIDHKSLIKSDNRWENLREATFTQNRANSAVRTDNSSGIKGVKKHPKGNTWSARIQIEGKRVFLGSFPTKELASRAYADAARNTFGEFARS